MGVGTIKLRMVAPMLKLVVLQVEASCACNASPTRP